MAHRFRQTIRQGGVIASFVKVRDIEQGVACLDLSGKGPYHYDYRGVVRVDTLNFALMSTREQSALYDGFQQILNGLSFPLQILVRILPYDLKSYLATLEHQHPEGPLAAVAQDHSTYLRYLASKRALVKRTFFLIIPADNQASVRRQAERKGLAQSQIALRIADVSRHFERLGLSTHRLEDEELVDLYQHCFSPLDPPLTPPLRDGVHHLMTAQGSPPSVKNSTHGSLQQEEMNHLSEDAAAAHTLPADLGTLAELLAPACVLVTPSYLRVDGESGHEYLRTLALTNYPRSATPGWLDYAIQLDEPYIEFSLFIDSLAPEQVATHLARKAVEFRGAALVAERQGKQPAPRTAHALHDLERMRDRLIRGDERVFALSLFILVRGAQSLQELEERTRRVQTTIRSLDFRVLPLHWQHHLAWLCTLPYNLNFLPRHRRLMGTAAAATFYPFTGSVPAMAGGVLFGVMPNGSLVIVNPFDHTEVPNANLGILGQSGGGKSTFLKAILARLALLGTRQYILDTEGEFRAWGRMIGATEIPLTAESFPINPLDLRTASWASAKARWTDAEAQIFFREKLANIVMVCATLCGEGGTFSQREKSFLLHCLVTLYEKWGITADPLTHGRPMPTIRDLHHLINATAEDAYGLGERLEQYLHLFPASTSMALSAPHIVFTLDHLPKSLKPVGLALLAEYLWSELRQTRSTMEQATANGLPPESATGTPYKTLIVLDEAHLLMESAEGAAFVADLARRLRKHGAGLWVSSQRSEDFLRSEQGRTILSMCAMKMLFREDVTSITAVGTTFRLTRSQSDFLRFARPGEALFLTAKGPISLEVVISQQERVMANTTLGAVIEPAPYDQQQPPILSVRPTSAEKETPT